MTLYLDHKLLPTQLNRTVELDTYVVYNESRPSPRRILSTKAQALHFEKVTLSTMTYSDWVKFVVRIESITAAGPYYAHRLETFRTFNTKHDDLTALFETSADLGVLTHSYGTCNSYHAGTARAFAMFCNVYDQAVSDSTVTRASKVSEGVSINLLAADSPFFYPLNQTNLRHLYSDEKRAATAHINHLHKLCEDAWKIFSLSLETGDKDVSATLSAVMPENPAITNGSILYQAAKSLHYSAESDFVEAQLPNSAPMLISASGEED